MLGSIPMLMGDSEAVWCEYSTGNYFSVLGIKPVLGRLLDENDDRGQLSAVAALDYSYWMRRFGGDPQILGRAIPFRPHPLTIVGVAAPGFRGVNVDRPADLWAPIGLAGRGRIHEPRSHRVWILARRRPELSVSEVQSAVDVLMSHHLSGVYGNTSVASFRKTAMEQRLQVREGGIGLSVLREQFGTALRVLLASCVNVANLLLARGAARRRETAMRKALGATRGRLVRQALTESVLLATLGCGLGILIAL